MYAFSYSNPQTTGEAVAASGQFLAGGQSLIPSMKLRLAQPGAIVDLNGVVELAGIRVSGAQVEVGAMTRHADVAASREVQAAIPALAQLAGGIGDRQVRARGTIGGSLANNDPAACYPSAVLGLGATVVTNQREIAADDFFQGMYTTALQEGELITAVRFPVPRAAAYLKFKQPASRFALVGVFVAQTAQGVRVAITGAGLSVFRHAGLEAALNQSFTAASAAGVMIDDSELNSDLHASARYRAQLISVQAQRAVTQMLG
ncbi:MAG: xanthine dehydrogenase family protein subunit M [Comamonas sp.]|jgi:carbon-monoxide dehydrogenase medium subunit|uniref:FAD binding domain-containing protein n=1 Tax=Comamonas sp. TaxID=34028 RepID=UPI002827EB9A|nr:xanthine dehydrogenase family protein subunit M [Comamonas sp.]MDR0213102.1 xanthine dehydrogenase family protein subunit M [Comamonas sp.]